MTLRANSEGIPRTALPHHVVGVLLMRSKEQMIWVAARRIVTSVADKARVVLGDWTVRQFVSNPVSMRGAAPQPEFAVAITAYIADPRPATICLVDARPEASRRIGSLIVIAAFLRAVLPDLRDAVRHQCAATLARLCNAARPNANAAIAVATMRAEAAHFARPALELHSAGDTRALHLRRVVLAEALVAFLEPLQFGRHIRIW